MKFFGKNKAKFGIAGNVFYTVIFLFTLVVAVNALVGVLTYHQPAVFGYSVSKIMSPSMLADGFKVDDYVITKKVRSANDIKVRDDAKGERGSIIAFYVDANKRPILEGNDRSDSRIMFHEVVGVNDKGEFITKGSSNNSTDPHPIPFESVSGVYIKSGPIMNFFIQVMLAENRFLYWIVAVLALIALKQLFTFGAALRDYKIQREVCQGKRRLLCKQCFEKNIFADFSDKEKKRLIDGAPYGMGLLYEYLLFGRVSERSDAALAKELALKRCGISDALYLTYAKEKDSDLDTVEYVKCLPQRKKKFDKYRNIGELKKESTADRNTAISLFLGCFCFFVLHFTISLALGYFPIAPWYEILGVVLLPIITAFYLFVVIMENSSTLKKLEEYLAISNGLPERYQFMVHPEDYSDEDIAKNVDEIRIRLLEGICDIAIEDEKGLIESDGQSQQKAPQQIIYVTQNFYGTQQDKDEDKDSVVELLSETIVSPSTQEDEEIVEVESEDVIDEQTLDDDDEQDEDEDDEDDYDDYVPTRDLAQDFADVAATTDFDDEKFDSVIEKNCNEINELIRIATRSIEEEENEEDFDLLNADITMDFGQLLGYDMDDNGKLTIVEKDAEIVRGVFRRFLLGKNFQELAEELNQRGVPCMGRSEIWRKTQVKNLLQNERYIGSVIIKAKNKDANGSWKSKQKSIKNNHDPIVSLEIFNAAADEMQRRSNMWMTSATGQRLQKGRFAFEGAIECGLCGQLFKCINYRCNGRTEKIWGCITKSADGSSCAQTPLRERYLEKLFILTLNELIADKLRLQEILTDKGEQGAQVRKLTATQAELDEKIDAAQAKLVELDADKNSGKFSKELYDTEIASVAKQLDALFEDRKSLEKEMEFASMNKALLLQINEIVSSENPLTEFDSDIFVKLVDKIIVKNKSDIVFILRNGGELKAFSAAE